MTPDQRDIYAEQKRAFELESTKKMIADAIKERFPTRFQELKADPANVGKSDAEINALVKAENDAEVEAAKTRKAEFEALKEDVQQIKEQTTGGAAKGIKIADEVKSRKEELKTIMKGAPGAEVTMKATVARSSIATNPNQMVIPGIGQLLRIARALYDVFRKVNLPVGSHNGTIKYIDWDETTTVKAAAAIAEGGTFPESTATFKGYSVDLKKVGDSLPVNEEFFEDEANAAAELDRFLDNNVESAIDTAIVNADGTGDTMTGLLASIPAFTPAASGIADANIYDLITKVKGVITTAGGNKYKPDFAAMNNNTINKLLLKKDANYQYLFPPTHPIYSMIVEDNNVADDTLVVGDGRYATIYELGGVTLSKGVVNTQFVKDQITLKARKRLLFLIRNSDKSGFRKVVGIDAALATLAS